jgi:hypothetical protein
MTTKTRFLGLAVGLTTALGAAAQDALYDPAGRRDPFVSFVTLQAAQKPSCPGPGLAARQVQELSLRGIVRTPAGRKALLLAPDGQTHFAREGAQLCDGRVQRIDADAVVFVQRLNDPLAPARELELRRPLHPDR